MLTLPEIKIIFNEASREFDEQKEIESEVDSEIALNFNDGDDND